MRVVWVMREDVTFGKIGGLKSDDVVEVGWGDYVIGCGHKVRWIKQVVVMTRWVLTVVWKWDKARFSAVRARLSGLMGLVVMRETGM